MPRADLQALSADDLAALTNRGTVKRAQKELETGDPTCHIVDDPDGGLTLTWSDGIVCRFPPGKTIHDAVCSSGLIGISRHVVRSVLAYQRHLASDAASKTSPQNDLNNESSTSTAATIGLQDVWNPGDFTDDDLVACFKKNAVAKARTRFEQGVLVELTRGTKPVARFLDEACTVRFPVPGDLRYATADCAESLWSTWIPLAVWAFRELPADQLAGLISLQQQAAAVSADAFSDLQILLDELCQDGISGVAPSWHQRLLRSEQRLRNDGFIWPAELMLELAQQHDMYRQHDAAFESDDIVHLVGELIARMRAITRGLTLVPQPLIRGTKSDRPTETSGGRFTGVGLGVQVRRQHTYVRAFLQETGSGNVVAIERKFAHPDSKSGDSPKPFDDLAQTPIVRGISLTNLATSLLLVQSGKRTPGGQLILPRSASQFTVNPQNYEWEQWKPPFAMENFAQLQARYRILPPSYLRPRRVTDHLHGICISGVEDVYFHAGRQQLTATLKDAKSERATLVHPFYNRGQSGFDAAFEMLQKHAGQLRFVSGHVYTSSQGLVVRPALLIFDDGIRRWGIVPWVDLDLSSNPATGNRPEAADRNEPFDRRSDIERFLGEFQQFLADYLVTGLRHGAAGRVLNAQVERSSQLGFIQTTAAIQKFTEAMQRRSHSVEWTVEEVVGHFQQLCLISRLALE